MSKPMAVVISDLHFNLPNLEIATEALKAARRKASTLQVPLIIAGDLQDTKAIIRAEVANRLISIFKLDRMSKYNTYLLIGNHDLINEKGHDNALNYLDDHLVLIDQLDCDPEFSLIPYFSDAEDFKVAISKIPKGSIIIMHQGVKGAAMGDYIVDKTSIDPELLKDYTVISGHYHRHQTIGTVTYIGSPYTTSFGEANDGPKGFLILNEDGTFTREILNFRKHVILETEYENFDTLVTGNVNPGDIIWLKVSGQYSQLETLNKDELGNKLFGHTNYKLDKIYIDTPHNDAVTEYGSQYELLDSLIDSLNEPDEQKEALKSLWRDLTQ